VNFWYVIGAVAGVLLLAFGLYLSQVAGRLDRLHRRVDAGKVSLDRALLERHTVASEVAGAMLPDPPAALVIADSVWAARRTDSDDEVARGLAESNLSAVLAASFDEAEAVQACCEFPGGAELMADLESATRRVQMSRRFLNDAVRACRDVRYQWLVRSMHLAGHTPWPHAFEMDDTPPPGFGVR
jgi:hypothetical protein